MKLSDSQIEELYGFTRQHFVECYDVQTELVDHLANDIEAICMKQAKLTFIQARDTSFKKFGVFGFMDVVAQKSNQMSKKYWKMVFNIFKEFFKIPQIIITGTIFIAVFTFFNLFPHVWVLGTIALIGMVLMLPHAFITKKKMKLRFERTQKKWMLEEHIYTFGNFVGGLNLIFQIALFSGTNSSNIAQILFALFLTFFSLIMYITAFVLLVRVEEILKNEYPAYNYATISK
jgi:hypothetical protein